MMTGQLKTQSEVEQALYILLKSLESKDTIEHQNFLSLILQYEENECDEDSVSYYNSIKRIMDFKI